MGGWHALRLFLGYNESYHASPYLFLPNDSYFYILLSVAICAFIFRRLQSGSRIEREKNVSVKIISQELVATDTIPVNIGQNINLNSNIMEPFTCKSCGASNQKSLNNTCDFCGSAGPAIYKSAPPLPQNTTQQTPGRSVADQYVLVDASGYVCLDCNSYTSNPDIGMPGYTIVEIALYFCYVIPGVIYSIWRRTQHVRTCKMCHKDRLIEVMTPEARTLFKSKYGRYPRFD
jgi:hypothetical protein